MTSIETSKTTKIYMFWNYIETNRPKYTWPIGIGIGLGNKETKNCLNFEWNGVDFCKIYIYDEITFPSSKPFTQKKPHKLMSGMSTHCDVLCSCRLPN